MVAFYKVLLDLVNLLLLVGLFLGNLKKCDGLRKIVREWFLMVALSIRFAWPKHAALELFLGIPRDAALSGKFVWKG